jgi:hypothetical protein
MPRGCTSEAVKAAYLDEFTKEASKAYDKILTRYPLMDRADDAKKRLAALKQPIPRPTKAAVAQNRAEIASRSEATTVQKLMGLMKKGPDVAKAAKVGEPNLVEPPPLGGNEVVHRETMAVAAGMSGNNVAGVEIVNPNQPSGTIPPSEVTPPGGSAFGTPPSATAPPAAPDPNELKPIAQPDPNELKPVDSGTDAALPPPVQVNEIHQGQSSSSSATASADNTPASDQDLSSSKKKKKKGLKKLVPF